MKGFFVGFSKLVLGVILALVIMSLAGVATARYFIERLSVLPERPTYENDNPIPPSETSADANSTAVTTTAEPAINQPSPEPTLEAGAYKAVVIQPIGLVLREGPGTQYSEMGGIEYNQQIVVIETSPDQQWLHVRLPGTGQEGWVKSGNTRPAN